MPPHTLRDACLSGSIASITSTAALAICGAAKGGAPSGPVNCIEAASVGALAYAVDYRIAPPRLRPGSKKHLGPRSIFTVYAAFAAGLALATIIKQSLQRRGRITK